MIYSFQSIDDFLFKNELTIINSLYEYDLLNKFNPSVKKLFFYYFVKGIEEEFSNNHNLFFYHDRKLSDEHELFQYFPKEEIEKHVNRITNALRRVTNRIFFLTKKGNVPKKAHLHELDGCLVDEISVLNFQKPVDPKELKKFLDSCYLPDLFKKLAKKVY